MIILTTAINYKPENVQVFLDSLFYSGFSGKVIAVCDNCPARGYLRANGVEIYPDINNGFPINTRRFLAYKEILRGVNEPAIITDVRDVVFQGNPEISLPTGGVHAFEEFEGMDIGSCPYNSKWMKEIFGKVYHMEKPIICAGFTVGQLSEYSIAMWEALRDLPPITGLDQAVHNHLIYTRRVPATVWQNEDSMVYTVGYIPRETVKVNEENFILNKAGEFPGVIHQYDRHQNLTAAVHRRFPNG